MAETVSVMLLVALPALLLATSEYVPPSAAWAFGMTWDEPVAPARFVPSRRHCRAGVGTPLTVAARVTVLDPETGSQDEPAEQDES